MGLQMSPEVALVGESSGARGAFEWFLPRVCSEVAPQQPRPGEGFSTELTLAGKRVGFDVHLESA